MSNRRKIRKSLPLGKNVDQVSAADRRYFDEHPGATTYVRRVQPGEYGAGIVNPTALVTVEQLAPGIRLRQVKL